MSFSRMLRGIATVVALTGSLLAMGAAPANDPPSFTGGPTHFADVPGGASIAMNVVFPKNYDPSKQYPTIFEMAGYENGSSSKSGRTMLGELDDWWTGHGGPSGSPPLANDSHEGTSAYRYDNEYVSVHASVRGTGCSSGEFELFGWQIALDGKYLIESWIPGQSWSNGEVAILGHSYSGITGFMVAATQPSNLKAISVSGLIDDLYRAISNPGGVSNGGFPVLWTLGIRPAYDILGGKAQGVARNISNENARTCARNIALQTRTVTNDPVVNGLAEFDGAWWQNHSLINYASSVNKPIHIAGAWQDEQTGPRGFTHLWENVATSQKRLLVTNGDHGTQVGPDDMWSDRKAWIDYFMGVPNATTPPQGASVRTAFERRASDNVPQGVKDSTSFPLNDTTWTPFFFDGNGVLSSGASAGGADSYFSGTGRQSWNVQAGPRAGSEFTTPDGPDELGYVSSGFGSDTAIAGPITANLFISSTAPDTELMVQVIDLAPDGSKTYLQRGVLRASHRENDFDSSDKFGTDPVNGGQFLYRPHRPHTSLQPIIPGDVYEYLVEVFPVGHIFRKDHKLLVKVHSPSRADSYYAYVPKTPAAINTLHHSLDHKSRITLPVVGLPQLIGSELGCGAQAEVRCIP